MVVDLKSENQLLEKIKNKFNQKGEIQRKKRVWIPIESQQLLTWASWIKKEGFNHLSAISVSDWLAEKQFKIDYILWSFRDKLILILTTKIDRDHPIIDSVMPVWGNNAQSHEREAWEFFGIHFKNNPDLTPLFTDDWHGPPPFKKDFDWHQFVRENYYSKENERERGYYDD